MNQQKTTTSSYSGIFMLTLCSFIWGTAFIAQSLGGQIMGPMTFNGSRSILASLFLLPAIFLFDRLNGRRCGFWGTDDPTQRKKLWRGGIICGLVLTIDSLFQQTGMMYTSVGKGGFITSLYIVIVPLLARFIFGRRVNIFQGIGVLIACIGMYFICLNESFSINKGDLFILGSAFFFAVHILSVEHFAPGVDGVRLSFFQFSTCAAINLVLMFIFEQPTVLQLQQALLPVCYAGIMSSGIAYTLQIVGQKRVNVVLATILLSLESVFALLSGWLFLHQVLSGKEIFGCVLVFAAIMLAQLPPSLVGIRETEHIEAKKVEHAQ